MNRIKYIFAALFIILIISSFFKYLKKGHISKYKIEKNENAFKIKETYTRNVKNELDNYYIEITVDGKKFNYQIFDDFDKKQKVVKDIHYYKDDNIACLYPVFINNYKLDIKCLKNNIFYNYHDLIGENKILDGYVDAIKEYNINDYIKQDDIIVKKYGISFYKNVLDDEHVISLTNLKGIYIINDKISNYELFEKDYYNRKISYYLNNFYITANYDEDRKFRNIYIVDYLNNSKKTIKSDNYISIDSYIQGDLDNQIYLYDKFNEKQYILDLNNYTIEENKTRNGKISNYNGTSFEYISKAKANKEVYFDKTVNDIFSEYDYVYKTGYKESGYYYLIKTNKNSFDLYRANVMDKDSIEYLFKTDNIDNLIFIDDYVYFINDDSIYYYSQSKGIKKVLEYSELKFNNNIKYGVSKK